MNKLFIFLIFLTLTSLMSCSKTCDCTITTRTKSYNVNYSLNNYSDYGVTTCDGLSIYLEGKMWENSHQHAEVSCVNSDRLF